MTKKCVLKAYLGKQRFDYKSFFNFDREQVAQLQTNDTLSIQFKILPCSVRNHGERVVFKV